MVEKTLKAVILKKIEDWLMSIEDEEVKKIARKNTIVTGGSIVSLMQNEKVKDYDIYMKTKEAALAIAEYYADQFNRRSSTKVEIKQNEERITAFIKSSGIAQEIKTETEKPKYRPVYITSNAITLSDHIQIIIRFYGNPEEIHKNFDFEHTKALWCSWDKKLIIPTKVYECVMNKTLIYTGSLYPICSLFRMRKFMARGWTINAGQILKIAFQISELDLTNVDVLEEQLIGVDITYFNQLIHIILEQKEKKQKMNIDQAYITEIVDRLF